MNDDTNSTNCTECGAPYGRAHDEGCPEVTEERLDAEYDRGANAWGETCTIAVQIMERERRFRARFHTFRARRALRIARIAKEARMPVELVQWLVTADRERELARLWRRAVIS